MTPMREVFRKYGIRDHTGRHVNGTDKETNHHYGDAYEGLFPQRDRVHLMMEIGVADGSSLLAWRDIFPNAHCVGMDIHVAHRLPPNSDGDRVEFHLGDQTNHQDCIRATANRQFDFICEDATHKLEDSLCTLLYMWPFVAPGGLYVIEEFANIGALERNVLALWPQVRIIDTIGPFGGHEPLVAFRKPTAYVNDLSRTRERDVDE